MQKIETYVAFQVIPREGQISLISEFLQVTKGTLEENGIGPKGGQTQERGRA
jgi:hypothetical protein